MDSKSMEGKPAPSRRGFMIGAGTAGAAAAAVATLPTLQPAPVPVAQPLQPVPEKGGGYQLSEHVKRYYKTTRI